MKKNNIFSFLSFLALIFFVFRSWVLLPEIIGGDWPYFFPEMLRDPAIYFSSWNPGLGNGLGGVNSLYFLSVFLGFTVFLAHTFSIPWVFIYKFFWFFLPLLFGILSSMYLVKTIFPKLSLSQQLLSSFIFTTNTYFLMVVGGGQMGVALAYSIAPLVLGTFMKLVNLINFSYPNFRFQISDFKFPIVAGLVLALQMIFDPRIAYLSMIAVALYLVLSIKKNILTTFLPLEALAKWGYLIFYAFVIPIGIAVLLHAFWLFPVLFLKSSSIPQNLFSPESFSFFSFADFSHAFSLLHPNWPENIFGKTYFMKSEFILLPILAYSSLLFFRKGGVLFFVLLGIIGAFLAKGANPPFGEINTFLFELIPGMNMFRDPTKFYLLIVLSYSVLIPFSIYSTREWVKSKIKNQKSKIQSKCGIFNFSYAFAFLIFAILYFIFLIHPALLGELSGTFQKREVPLEYVKLKDFLYKQPGFFRTLWIPRQHRFAYNFWSRMPVEAQPLLKKSKVVDIVNQLRKTETKEYLSDLGIKYVIVPDDPSGEIFVKDRKYDVLAYQQAVRRLEATPWLKKIDGFGKIVVFEAPAFKDYFSLTGNGRLAYKMNNVTNYNVSVDINNPERLLFAENYNPDWAMKKEDRIVRSEKTLNGLNSFVLEKGKYSFEIVFLQDKFYIYGRAISLVTFLGALFFIFRYRKC